MPTFFHSVRAAPVGWWNSERGRNFRFYADYFRLPVLFILGALIIDKSAYYGAFPLVDYAEGKADYFVARMETARGQDQAALGSIRAALLHSRTDPAFWKLAAQISDRLDSPEATYCWRQSDLLEPGSFPTQISLAQSALRYQQLDSALAALQDVAPADQETVSFQETAAELADACGEKQLAREHFSRVAAAHPTDAATLCALARWQAESGQLPQARRQLLALVLLPDAAAPEIRRLLVSVSLQDGDRAEAKKWSDDLLRSGQASFADRVQRLDILPGAPFAAALKNLMASTDQSEIVPVVDWLVTHGLPEKALDWLSDRPRKIQANPHIRRARADCLSALGLWAQLRAALPAENWLGLEVQRLMYLSRAHAEMGDDANARAAWSEAVLACRNYPDYLALLQYLARHQLGGAPASFWAEARVQVLTQMLARYPGQAWIVRALLQDARARHDSLRVEECWAQLAAIDPDDIDAAAYEAQLSLLRGSRIEKASALLQRLLAGHPANPALVTASAYDLSRRGRFGDAMALMGGLSPEELAAPERAPYLAALLAVAGPLDQAQQRVDVALSVSGLLPEERALAQRSREFVDYREAMAALLHPPATAADSGPENFPALILAANEVPAIFLVGQSVALSRSGSTEEAARVLSRVDPAPLDPAALSIYLGGLLDLAGQRLPALPYLELSADLPYETMADKYHRAVDVWWSLQTGSPHDPAPLAGLLAAYRGLDLYENGAAFWSRDAPREMGLIHRALLHGQEIAAVQERLHGLLRHVPATPEMQIQAAYALLLQGQALAARDRMDVLAPADLALPEPSLYYGVILAACGKKRDAHRYLQSALKSRLDPDETALAARAEKML